MNISHEWLRGFVPHDLSPHALGDLLSRHVVTLDGVTASRADLAPIVVARVMASEKVPDTKLSFNKVDDGSGVLLDVVCGAPNVQVGALYPFARSGTVLPGGLRIEQRKIRGMTSNGMLCSARELGLGTDHEGILALDIAAAPGTPLLEAMPLGDTLLDLDVLPNRPDLLSHFGVAREVAALTGVAVQLPAELRDLVHAPESTTGTTDAAGAAASVRVRDTAACPRYIAVIIRGVRVATSPPWLAQRVESIGSRSINNVVDATNYVLHGLGQPVHAFDLAKLAGASIVVRKAAAGESLVTLDGVARKLEPWMTIIADGERPTALAGVLGGRDSEVTAATGEILLEVAAFAPRDVRRVRRALGLSTDASYRFERGVDGGATEWVARLAAGLIVSVAGGTVEALLDVGVEEQPRPAIALHGARVNRLLGTIVPADEIDRLLRSIGFLLEEDGADAFTVRAPSWRHDIARDVDLVEEIARLRGYDVLPDVLQPYRPSAVPDHPLHLLGRRVRDTLVAAGLAEARPMPFTRDVPSVARVRVANPLAEDEPCLRDSVLESLARCAEANLNQREGNVRLFEIGDAFTPVRDGLPREEVRVAALLMGARRPPHFTEPRPPAFDAWDAKALAQRIAEVVCAGHDWALVSGEGDTLWRLQAGGSDVGSVRRLTLDAPVWAAPAFGVEVMLGVMPSVPAAPPGTHLYAGEPEERRTAFARVTPLPTTPAAEFDLALLVPDRVAAADVELAMCRAGGALLERLQLFDEFRGAGVPDGTRSLAWRLTWRHPERTLREKEIEGRRSQLLKTLESELGVTARTS